MPPTTDNWLSAPRKNRERNPCLFLLRIVRFRVGLGLPGRSNRIPNIAGADQKFCWSSLLPHSLSSRTSIERERRPVQVPRNGPQALSSRSIGLEIGSPLSFPSTPKLSESGHVLLAASVERRPRRIPHDRSGPRMREDQRVYASYSYRRRSSQPDPDSRLRLSVSAAVAPG